MRFWLIAIAFWVFVLLGEPDQLMAGSPGPSNFNLNCYRFDDGVQGEWLGGADNLSNTITIACAVFAAMEQASPRGKLAVAVLNNTGNAQAWVGRQA